MPFVPRNLAFGAFCLSACGVAFADNGEYVKSYPVTGRAEVSVRADDARVRITTSSTTQVEFRVAYSGYTLGRTLEIDSRKDGNRIELVESVRPHRYSHWELRDVSIEVLMPKDADLRVVTGDGDVHVASLNGHLLIRSGDGDLEGRQLTGRIDFATNDGDIRMDNAKGDLRLRTGDGTTDGTNLDGECEASSGDGEIHLAGRFDALSIRSGDGGAVARVASGSKMSSTWSIHSGDGDVDVTLPKNFKATLHASTNDGRIEVAEPIALDAGMGRTKARGDLNGGGPMFLIRTGDGAIRIDTR